MTGDKTNEDKTDKSTKINITIQKRRIRRKITKNNIEYTNKGE